MEINGGGLIPIISFIHDIIGKGILSKKGQENQPENQPGAIQAFHQDNRQANQQKTNHRHKIGRMIPGCHIQENPGNQEKYHDSIIQYHRFISLVFDMLKTILLSVGQKRCPKLTGLRFPG